MSHSSWLAALRMMGLLFLIGIAAFVAFPGSAAAATPDSALPCHEATATTMDHHGGAIDHAHQGSKAHQSGSCCSIASCHAAMETILPDLYAPIPVAGRIAGGMSWIWQDARFRLERPPRLSI